MSNNVRRLLLALPALILFASHSFAQGSTGAANRHWGIPDKPENPEMNALNMEHVRGLMRARPNPHGVIILIARLGRGETKRDLNRRRLFNVGERYRVTLGIPAEKIVAAEGERVNDFGRVEIYWNGELIGALVAHRNSDIHVYCCGPNEMYYPDKDSLERRQKQIVKRRRRG